MRQEIAVEIRAAHDAGLAWTPFRPFLDDDERVGAMRCNTIGASGECKQQSTHISYATFMRGCVVSCDSCLSASTDDES